MDGLMQTFLPYPNFSCSAMVLDDRRLGKQRLEARTIQDHLQGRQHGWARHPAVRMWEGHTLACMLYGDCVIREWARRGFVNNFPLMILRDDMWVDLTRAGVVMPPWLGNPALHASHRANLLRKDPQWYGQFQWSEQPQEGYLWPEPGETT